MFDGNKTLRLRWFVLIMRVITSYRPQNGKSDPGFYDQVRSLLNLLAYNNSISISFHPT